MLPPNLETPVMPEAPVKPHFLQPLEIFTPHGVQPVSRHVAGLAILNVFLSIQKPRGNAELSWAGHDCYQLKSATYTRNKQQIRWSGSIGQKSNRTQDKRCRGEAITFSDKEDAIPQTKRDVVFLATSTTLTRVAAQKNNSSQLGRLLRQSKTRTGAVSTCRTHQM